MTKMTPGSQTVELRSTTQAPVSCETETKNNQAPQERLTNERGDPAPQRDEEPERETEMHSGTWTEKTKSKKDQPRTSARGKESISFEINTRFLQSQRSPFFLPHFIKN
jgi:hypothetical protein